MSTRLSFACLALSGASLLLAGCSSGDTAPPVGSVAMEINRTRVALGSPLELTYRFTPTEGIDGDYRVFSHVVDNHGALMWTDDHDPPVPTSSWRPGEPVEYTRTVFVPIYPYLGEARLFVGLHKGAERLPLTSDASEARHREERAYPVATLQLLPQAESIFLIYGNGWHQPEYAPSDPTRGWQWTEKSAIVTFRNPREDVRLYLQYDARPDVFDDMPQEVTVLLGGQPVDKFVADSLDPALRVTEIDAVKLGSADMAELRIDVNKTFFPARISADSTDNRELGIRVYHLFVEPR